MLVLLPHGAAPDVVACLQSWSASAIVGPFIWAESPERVLRCEHGEVTELSPADALQGVDPRRVEAVAFVLGEPTTLDEGRDALRARFEAVVEPLPFGLRPEFPALVLIPRANGATGWTGKSAGFLPVVVIAPEDRSHPGDASTLDDDSYAAHAAHGLVSLAGALVGEYEHRPLVALREQAMNERDSAFVVRSYTRGVDAGYVVDHVASGVLRPGVAWPNPDPTRFDPVPLHVGLAAKLVDGYLDAHRSVFTRATVPPRRVDEPTKTGIIDALRQLFAYLIETLRRKPIEWLDRRVGKMHDSIAKWIEVAAPQSGIKVVRWRGEINGASVQEVMRSQLEHTDIAIPDGMVTEAWEDLRTLTIGLTDGSDLPTWVEERDLRSAGRRLIVTRPAALVPDPTVRPSTVDGDDRACDPRGWDPLAEMDDDAADPLAQQRRAAFLTWHEGVSASLLWAIGRRLAGEHERAAAEAIPPEDDEWPDPVETQRRLERAQRRSARSIIVLLGVLSASLTAAVAWLWFASDLSIWLQLAGSLASPFAWLAGAVTIWRSSRSRIARAEREATKELEDVIDRLVLSTYRAADVVRLDRRYREYLDWSEIQGHLLHRPIVPAIGRTPTVATPVDRETLPAAFHFGEALMTDDDLGALLAGVRHQVFDRGWLRTFSDQVDVLVMAELEADRRTPSAVPESDVSNDPRSERRVLLAATRVGAHRTVVDSPLTKRLLAVLGNENLGAIASAVSEESGTAGQQLAVTGAWMGQPDGVDALVPRLSPFIHRVVVTSADGCGMGTAVSIDSGGTLVTASHVVAGATSIVVELRGRGVVDASVLRDEPSLDLALLRVESEGDLPSASLGDPASQGSIVILMGHAFDLQGEATLTVGMVAATERVVDLGSGPIRVVQTTYPGGGGASGGGVFDRAGQLVGIHVGGAVGEDGAEVDSRAAFVSFAVGVDVLRQLLDGTSVAISPMPVAVPVVGVGVGEFLEPVRDELEDAHFSPYLWRDGGGSEAVVDRTSWSSEVAIEKATLTELSGDLAFLAPLRLWLTRTDYAKSCLKDRLTIVTPPVAEDGDVGSGAEDGGIY